jgi:hypothetical protein
MRSREELVKQAFEERAKEELERQLAREQELGELEKRIERSLVWHVKAGHTVAQLVMDNRQDMLDAECLLHSAGYDYTVDTSHKIIINVRVMV